MNCNEVQEMFGLYWDLPDEDPRRILVSQHLRHCPSCAQEFEMWKESVELIRTTTGAQLRNQLTNSPISRKVMARIYEDEAWRTPIPDRIYKISYTLRRNLTAIIVCCMVLFLFSFLVSVSQHQSSNDMQITDNSIFGIQPVASVNSGGTNNTYNVALASANISEPFMLEIGPIRTVPDYMLVLSLLGIVCTLLIMNWLNRTKI